VNRSRHLIGAKKGIGGSIHSVFKACQTFSSQLERLALENEARSGRFPLRASLRELTNDTGSERAIAIAERAQRRQATVMPILKAKLWKPGRLATMAGVGKNSVYRYLDGTRTKISSENRNAIAQVLDLMPEHLPD
jgi:hypothetical protein